MQALMDKRNINPNILSEKNEQQKSYVNLYSGISDISHFKDAGK